MSINGLLSCSIQILGFVVFLTAFLNYYKERTGVEFTKFITKGAKMYKDSNGVPNIEAETLEDGYFALGFTHAEDRLWQMYFSQKVALGEVSELFGEGALAIDHFARVLNFREVCNNAIKHVSDEEKVLIDAYVRGVNHYIESTYLLPLEFLMFGVKASDIKWEPKSSCLVGKLIEYYLTFDFFQEMMRTYLLEHANVSKDLIDKLFPFTWEDFQYRNTIVKDNEMKHLRVKTVIKTMKDVQYASTEENRVKPEKIITDVRKGEATIETTEYEEESVKSKPELADVIRKEKGTGSNNFVISGKLTKNGHPYVCNDPHLQNSMPSFWYFINLKVNQEYHFTGATSPGVPTLFIGTNSHIAWAITNGLIDTADFIRIEKSRVNKDLQVKFEDNSEHKLTKRIETFYFDIAKTASVKYEFMDSEFGPVVNGYSQSLVLALGNIPYVNMLDENKYYYILRSTFTDKDDSNLKGMLNIALSKSIEQLRKNLSYLSISLNIVFADKSDNIGYQLTGKIPKKYHTQEGAFMKTATLSSDFKTETIPWEEMPHLINPERGYIVTSNNIIVGNDYKYLLQGGFIMDARARALEADIQGQIAKGEKITADFIINTMLKNVKDAYCRDILDLIFGILKKDHVEVKQSLLLGDLMNFDCVMSGDSTNALIYNVFENEIHHLLHISDAFEEKIGKHVKMTFIEADERVNYLVWKLKLYQEDPSLCLKEYKKSCGEFIAEAFNSALETIKGLVGSNMSNWKWENVNIKHYPHKPFSFIPGFNYIAHRTVKTDGNWRTAKVSIPKYYGKDFESKVSSNLKYLINLHHKESETYFSVDSGQNGRIFHKHYDDLQVNHEKGILVHFDPTLRGKFTLEFKKK